MNHSAISNIDFSWCFEPYIEFSNQVSWFGVTSCCVHCKYTSCYLLYAYTLGLPDLKHTEQPRTFLFARDQESTLDISLKQLFLIIELQIESIFWYFF
jgi:hypothetical protein